MKNACLYDLRDKNYHNKVQKDKIVKEIAEELGTNRHTWTEEVDSPINTIMAVQ